MKNTSILINTQHEDLIHDTCYDYYGKRIATCSSDQKIKIWDQNEKDEWFCSAEWKAHSGSIWKLAWAHPEFGQVIASCSFDRTVCIWEESENKSIDDLKQWNKMATLVDSRDSVPDIKFAPKHLGLKLATCSTDGFVRVYEAIDITNLSHWNLMEEFESQKGGVTCLSWNPSPMESKPMLAVGGTDANVKIWEYNETHRRWVQIETLSGHKDEIHDVCWSPNIGRNYHLIATASKDGQVKIWKMIFTEKKIEVQEIASFPDHNSEVLFCFVFSIKSTL
jgi:nucleoporin SEH1